MWAARTGNELRLVSANDHIHALRSLHYEGLAADFWASDMDSLAEWMERVGYRVFWKVAGHMGHVHAEAARILGHNTEKATAGG